MKKSFKNWLLAGVAALPGFGFAGDFDAKEAQPVAQEEASAWVREVPKTQEEALAQLQSIELCFYYLQPYTREALEKSPFQLMGTDEEKAKLWAMCQKLAQTETGRKVLQEVGDIYKKTGEKLPIRIALEDVGTYAAYRKLAGVIINQKYQDRSDVDVSLAHELTHHIQKNRAINEENIEYENLQDAFVAHKMLELETKLQDVTMLDEKGVVSTSDFDGLLKYYQSEKKEAEKKYGKNSPAAKRYARTQTAKLLWEGEEPFFTQVGRLFQGKSANHAYEDADYWNKAYNVQTGDLLWLTEDPKLKPNCADKTTALLQQFADRMGVDLTPDYFRDNLNLASVPADISQLQQMAKSLEKLGTLADDLLDYFNLGEPLNVSKNEMRYGVRVIRLEKNDKGGYTLRHYSVGRIQRETVFDKNGQCVFSIVAEKQAETPKEASKEAPQAAKAQTTPQVKEENSLKKTLSQNAEKKKANQATNVQGLIKNQGR